MQAASLKKEIEDALDRQGYELANGGFRLREQTRDALRNAHKLAKAERISGQRKFILKHRQFIKDRAIDGSELAVEKIRPKLIIVQPASEEEVIFRWWNHVWWSLPYEKAYGRQMRYVVWDEYHKAPIGLIGMQSPILSWGPRDKELGISRESRDYWVNQSMNIQRLGALPPYNRVLGGKLVAMLSVSDRIRRDFHAKYSNRLSVMQNRELPANLLFSTTTGAFGKSSIFNRLKDGAEGEIVAKYIGDSSGSGSFHIPNVLYFKILEFLEGKGIGVARGYGHGPSRKMRLIDRAMALLGYKNGNKHGIHRAIYLFSYVKNLNAIISGKETRPVWTKRSEKQLTKFWKERWGLRRLEKDANKRRSPQV